MSDFDYLLNAFEAASQSDKPAANGYANKRKALFAYVRELEAARRSPAAVPADRALMEQALEALESVLSTVRVSNQMPDTVMQAESKLDAVRAAGGKARAAIAALRTRLDEPGERIGGVPMDEAGRHPGCPMQHCEDMRLCGISGRCVMKNKGESRG